MVASTAAGVTQVPGTRAPPTQMRLTHPHIPAPIPVAPATMPGTGLPNHARAAMSAAHGGRPPPVPVQAAAAAAGGQVRKATPTSSGRPAKKRRGRNSAVQKGLRHFSMKVCQKVEAKGKTTYNEVADELVREYAALKTPDMKTKTYDEKNIRRRVYDALNVLMAMDIIAKERKEISWRGLPSNSKDELEALKHAHKMTKNAVEKKKEHLRELLLQQIAFKKLLSRNQARAATTPPESRIHLPFIVISTSDQTTIQLEMDTPGRRDLFFNFSAPFEIHDDHEILMRMNLHQCDPSELSSLVPPEMIPFLPPDIATDQTTASLLAGAPEVQATPQLPAAEEGPSLAIGSAIPAPPSMPSVADSLLAPPLGGSAGVGMAAVASSPSQRLSHPLHPSLVPVGTTAMSMSGHNSNGSTNTTTNSRPGLGTPTPQVAVPAPSGSVAAGVPHSPRV